MSAQAIAAVIAVLSALNVIASQFGFTLFADGQIEVIVDGASALYVVIYGIYTKIKQSQAEAALMQAQRDAAMYKDRYDKAVSH